MTIDRKTADRIDGWKSIGAHFGRDRTTAIRWARERDLPVHRFPGGKTATVYALRHELDLWAKGGQGIDVAIGEGEGGVEDDTRVAASVPPSTGKRKAAMAALAVVVVIGAGWFAMPWIITPAPAEARALVLPRDAVTADHFLKGRDLLADREAQSIESAIKLLRDVSRRDPGYGPGYAALAEALILSREFGTRGDRQAFPEARAAAREALRLSPNLATAHRVNGFVAYWWDQDFAAARQYFEKAIALAPADATGHFWYGNILADHGDSADALSHLRQARTMAPGSVPIQTDLAWALWSAGQRDEAFAALTDLARRHPDFAVIHDCLAVIHLAEGDYAAYAAAQSRVAALRQNATLQKRVAAVSQALPDGPDRAGAILLEFARADLASGESRTHAWAAFVASAARDRGALLAILREAGDRKESWGDAGLLRQMRAQWGKDREVMALLTPMQRR